MHRNYLCDFYRAKPQATSILKMKTSFSAPPRQEPSLIKRLARLAGATRLRRGAFLIAATCLFTVRSQAQPDSPPAGGPPSANGDGNAGGWHGNFNREDMQARILSNLRTQFEVTDDAEWKLIADRITKVMDLRRSVGGGGFGMGGFRGGGNQGNRQAAAANPEGDALRTALEDKLPDAEIKARLERLRAARKQSEVRLDQAREDLRAVLTVRQEAVAVLMGLLP